MYCTQMDIVHHINIHYKLYNPLPSKSREACGFIGNIDKYSATGYNIIRKKHFWEVCYV